MKIVLTRTFNCLIIGKQFLLACVQFVRVDCDRHCVLRGEDGDQLATKGSQFNVQSITSHPSLSTRPCTLWTTTTTKGSQSKGSQFNVQSITSLVLFTPELCYHESLKKYLVRSFVRPLLKNRFFTPSLILPAGHRTLSLFWHSLLQSLSWQLLMLKVR